MSLSYEEWIQLGMDEGWCGPPVCHTHDGVPTTEAEDLEFDEGDPCIHIVRMYDSAQTKIDVESNHSPSVWRKL